ncbi:MAG: RuBisCO large subunit C-terminal-like domain-containing protein [Opitutaceae bacterium]|nr:RuBisCO large subunit C-terminal-like domain-containing protein [Opitutaceae bacterium]
MKRYYDSEIFHQMLDGIDLDNHVIATYYLRDRLEGEKFLDHLALVQAMGLEGSTGTWEKVAEDTEEVRRAMSSKMVGYHEIPTGDPYTKSAVVQLAFPIRAWGDNVPMMLLAIAGNCFAYSKNIMLTDLFVGKNLLAKFKGPKFGVDGIRKLTGVQDRPLSLHIIKPKMGMTPEQTANQVRQTVAGGADMCKDDEMLCDAYNNTVEQRVPKVMEVINRAADKTGKKMIYLCSITDGPKKMADKARRAIDLGANGLLVTYSAGLGTFRELTSHPDINVPVMLHASHMIAMMKQIAWPVLAKLCRLCGADLMLTPTMWSSIPMVSMEEGLRTSFMKLAPWQHIKRTFPMPCAGVYPGLAEVIIGEYGPDIIIPAGGGMLGHPDGYTAGAQAWQQAIAAVMAGVPLPEAARQQDNKALRRALEKWGYMERPKSPWLRLAPAYQPKPMKFDV